MSERAGMLQRDDGVWIWPGKITVARIDPDKPLEPPETCPSERTVIAAFRDGQGGTLTTLFRSTMPVEDGWTMLGWQEPPEGA